MKTINSKCLKLAKQMCAVALVTTAPLGYAATSWIQDLQANCGTASTLFSGPACNTTGGSSTGSQALSIGGWSTGTGTTATPTAGVNFSAAAIYNWGTAGLGIVATNEDPTVTGPHAFDNVYGTDAMLLKFTGAVNLNKFSIGWNGTQNGVTGYTDSDVSILAWTGAASAPTMVGATLSTLLTTGWSLVGNYGDVGGNPTAGVQAVGGAIYSSYWLVSAYNSAAFGTTNSGSNSLGTLGDNNDAFKLLTVAGSLCQSGTGGTDTLSGNTCTPKSGSKVPEPGSLALLGLGLVGMYASRKRASAAV